MQITDEMVEVVAECIWQAEWKRAGNGGLRRVPWCEIGDKDQERYRFVAREVTAVTAALAHGEPVAWRHRGPKGGWIYTDEKQPWSEQPVYAHPTPQPSGPVQAHIEHTNGKRWRIESADGRWTIQPEGKITADEARVLCERILSALTAGEPAQVPSGPKLHGFSLENARNLVEQYGGDETDMTVEFIRDGHSGPGFYCWCTEYPEDGSTYLGPASEHSYLSVLPVAPTAGGGDD